MATRYLSEGATSFNAAAWGGGAMAATDIFIIELPFGTITGSELDQSGIVGGFESMDIKPGSSGTIGGGANGAFIADFDNSADAFVSNRGSVTMYITAGGDGATINNYDCGPKSINVLQGGTFTDVTMDGGTLTANGSTIITNLYLLGGASTVEYHATDATLIQCSAGTHVIKRMPTTLEVSGTARVTLDPDDAEGFGSKVITITGGTLIHRAGAVPTVNAKGGTIDYSDNRRTFTPGGTAFVVSGAKIIESPAVPMSNVTYVGALSRNVGGFTPVP